MKIFSGLKKIVMRKSRPSRAQRMAVFNSRYASFKELLQANADLAGTLAVLNAVQYGERSMEISRLKSEVQRAVFLCERMAVCLDELSGRHRELIEIVGSIGHRILDELKQHTSGDVTSLTLPLSEVDASMAYSVGSKNANLGELGNILSMPIPRGFAITIKAGVLHLLRTDGLFKNIHLALRSMNMEDPANVRSTAAKVQQLIVQAPVPDEVASALYGAWDETFGHPKILTALRSSALGEDGVQSFAGQYRSILGVSRDTLLHSFKLVVGSLFSARALAYRANHGYGLEASGMGLCCVEMVQAKAAGVAFSRHPVDLRSNCVMINGLWGLGEMVVDGSGTPDAWLVSRASHKIKHESIAHKETRLVLTCANDIVDSEVVDVPENLRDVPCLTQEQVKQLTSMVLKLERHYQYPQDMEWAIDEDDQIILLQTRPMGLDSPVQDGASPPLLKHIRPLLGGAEVAAKGVGCGPVKVVQPQEDLTHFPEGAVMLMQHSSPNAMAAMHRAAAIIAETGSLTGHMASVCREFGVPTLMNMPGVTSLLEDGQVVTVDALSGRIFDGEIPELLALRLTRRRPIPNTPTLILLRRVAPHILPLHLLDPHSETFVPNNCTSLHDVMRYAHELSYSEMFLLSDRLTENCAGGMASRLLCAVPLDLYVIDLGGGLDNPDALTVRPENILSEPFQHILSGMLNPDVRSIGPRPVSMRGFLSVMSQSMIGGNQRAGERFGERSYAIVSDSYLNFSSRVGYHYAILDTWCGDILNKNYIRFEFAGGAAGSVQRERRVRCIGLILQELGFTIQVSGDRVLARFQKYPKLETCSRLDQLGRLLIMTRQMDMLMVNEAAVQDYASRFLSGEYH